MAISRDSSATGTASAVTSHTDSYTVGATASLLIVFHVYNTTAGPSTETTATWNGNNMTAITGLNAIVAYTVGYKFTAWYMTNPDTGTHNVVTGTTNSEYQQAYIYSYIGTDTTSAVIDGTNAYGPTGSASAISSNITVTASNCWIVALGINAAASAGFTGSGAITKLLYTGSMTAMTADSNGTVGTGSIAYGFTGANGAAEGNLFGVSIAPYVAAGPTNLKSYDGNVKANIKSMDGNAIANVKSFDGNS